MRGTGTARICVAVVLGLLALGAAACTDQDDDGVASADGSATAGSGSEGGTESHLDEMLAFAECMRENGIPDMPDPVEEDGGVSIDLPEGVSPDDEVFMAAEKACQDLMPGPGEGETIDPEVYAALIEFADCMRTNGIEDYPDPEPNGGMRFDLDTETDEFKAAAETCENLYPEGYGPEDDSGDGE